MDQQKWINTQHSYKISRLSLAEDNIALCNEV